MPATSLAETETVIDEFALQPCPGWEVAAISDVKRVQELSARLKADGVAECRLVAVGPSAFFLFWREI